jgi:hypoxanthine-guanine phosphoribosyltransferase
VAVRAKEKFLWAHTPAPLKLFILVKEHIRRHYEIGYGIDYTESYRQLPDICARTIPTPRS